MTPDTLLHGHALATLLAALLPAALLVALGSVLLARQGGLGLRALPMLGTAALLVATGLWWPGHVMTVESAGPLASDLRSLLSWAGSFALAAAAGAAALLLTRPTLWFGAGAAAAALVCAFGHGVLALGSDFTVAGIPATTTLAVLAVLLATPLVLAQRPSARLMPALAGRAVAALGLAALTTAAAASAHPVFGTPAAVPPWILLLPLAAMAAMALCFSGVQALSAEALAELDRPSQITRAMPDVDPLTQLPTRTYFEQQLGRAVNRCDVAGSRLALLFIDLDGFKPVNDTFGHSSGDHVLEQVGERLKTLAHHGNVVARVGGDEFLMLVPGGHSVEMVAQLATNLIERLSKPYLIEAREVSISCSIGIVFYPDNGAHTKLIARADAAMYSAKRAGGSCYAFYTPEMDADAREQFDLLRDLRKALERNELELFYQPKIDARSGQVTAAEALLRWKHPTRGIIPPGVFIPVAERFGLIGALGNWVIDDACRQSKQWREQGLRMRVAINLSAQQMRQEDIVDRIVGALDRNRIQPSLFTCEITETVAMEDTKATQNTLRRMGEAGIHLSIDDFGTGYSSLSYLRRLPAEELKIDRSFVKDVEQSPDARAVIDAVVKLAHALGLRVVAEGVETQHQQDILIDMGCDELQGYLFAKPMSARSLLLWAIDDRPEHAAFRASLFSETLPDA